MFMNIDYSYGVKAKLEVPNEEIPALGPFTFYILYLSLFFLMFLPNIVLF